jgi:pimeloyl-ACP methyl ester carboxylesterase
MVEAPRYRGLRPVNFGFTHRHPEINEDFMSSRTIVLVQGAWGSSASWTPVAELLRSRGHRIHVPSLTGLGERCHLFNGTINLDTHIADVAGLIENEGLHDFVLVGHSYGGMVVTGVADRFAARIRTLIYLDAFVPEDGQSVLDLLGPTVTLANIAAAGENGGLGVPAPIRNAERVPEELKFHVQNRSLQPLGAMVQKIRLTGAHLGITRRLYVSAEIDQAPIFTTAFKRVSADAAWTTRAVQSGHMLQLEMADGVAAIIDEFIA